MAPTARPGLFLGREIGTQIGTQLQNTGRYQQGNSAQAVARNADEVGFSGTGEDGRGGALSLFKTGALNHSATLPCQLDQWVAYISYENNPTTYLHSDPTSTQSTFYRAPLSS